MPARPRFYDGPRMSDLAGDGEGSWLTARLREDRERGRTVLGVQGWTHAPARLLRRRPLLDALRAAQGDGTAVALQVSFTGLGATVLEPGIGPLEAELEALGRLVDALQIPWDAVCARVDPLQAYRRRDGSVLENLSTAPATVALLAGAGVRHVRSSAVQIGRYRARIERRLNDRGLRHVPLAPAALEEAARAMAAAAADRGAALCSCACPLPGVVPGACFDPSWLRSLCRLPERERDAFWIPERPVAPRAGCLCSSPAAARMMKIPKRSSCAGGCVACYAQD